MTINGREFTVTAGAAQLGLPSYVLTGERGATYRTMRVVRADAAKPVPTSTMFLADVRGFGIPAGFERVRLSDAGGSLQEVRR